MEVFSCYKRFILSLCVMAIFSWLPVFLANCISFISQSFSLFLEIIYWGNMRNSNEKLVIFVGMFGQFTDSISEIRMFSKVKENRTLQFREKSFFIDYGNSWANLFRWQHFQERLFCSLLIYAESAVGFVKLRTSVY